MDRPIALGPFVVQAPLGHGGMGEVWAGVHAAQGLPVAVKVLTAEWTGDERTRARLRDEVEAVAALTHPGIVMVLDFGLVDAAAALASQGRLRAGSPYLVMERAEHGTLRDLQAPRAFEPLRELLLALLDALAHAHARGVVHRDVKPSNVLLFGSARRWRPKLCDFGLAYLAGRERATGAGASSASSSAAGTPWFMAPEQVAGAYRDYGPWTDLYALGCLGWLLCAGRPLFAERAPAGVLDAQLAEEPPPLRARVTLPDGFEAWLRRLLAKRPEARFQRAADAAWALRRLSASAALDVPPQALEAMHWATSDDAATQDLERSASSFSLTAWPTPTRDVRALPLDGQRADGAQRSAGDTPPWPGAWQAASAAQSSLPLLDAGLGLYGLRSLPFVGRERERDTLWRALGQVHASRRARLVSLEGPAGHGKSRLAAWLAERAHELGAATVLRVVHGPSTGLQDGLARAVAQHLACDGLAGEALAQRVRTWLQARGGAPETAFDALVALASPDAGRVSPGERHDAVRALLDALARERPVVLLLEDVQWGADALAFALDLVRRDEPRPVLIVTTASDEALLERAQEAALLRALWDEAGGLRLELPALEGDERRLLVQALLPLEPGLAARVEARTAGNPLFAVQLVGDWVARGLLRVTPGGFDLAPGSDPALPDDLHAVWPARLTALAGDQQAETRASLWIAAALGFVTRVDEWQTACESAGVALPTGLVDRLVTARLARRVEGGFTFVNAMLRDSLEREAREAGRWSACNAACARMLSGRRAERAGDAERLGRHLLAAGQPQAAVEPLLRGARERRESSDYGRAHALLVEREDALREAGARPADRRWGEGYVLRSRVHLHEARLDEAARWAELAEREAARHGWSVVRAEALRLLGDAARRAGDLARATRLYENCIALERPDDDPHAIAASLWGLGDVLRQSGEGERAASCFGRSRSLYEAIGDRHGLADHLIGSADLARQRGELESAALFYAQAEARFEDLGNRYGVARSLNGLGEVARARGDLATADERYRRAAALLALIRSAEELFPRVNLGFVELLRGHGDEAEALLDEAALRLARLAWAGPLACTRLALASCALARHDLERAETLTERAGAWLAQSGLLDPDAAWAARLLAQRAEAAGATRLATEAGRIARLQERGLRGDTKPPADT